MKEVHAHLIKLITELANASFSQGKIPECLKVVHIKAIPKKQIKYSNKFLTNKPVLSFIEDSGSSSEIEVLRFLHRNGLFQCQPTLILIKV